MTPSLCGLSKLWMCIVRAGLKTSFCKTATFGMQNAPFWNDFRFSLIHNKLRRAILRGFFSRLSPVNPNQRKRLFKREIGLQAQGVGSRKGWKHQQSGKGREGAMPATVVHQLAHLLIVEIGMAEQGAEGGTIDGQTAARWRGNMEPTAARNQGRVDFIELVGMHKPTQPVAIIHYAVRPIGTDARHTLQQGSVGSVEIEHGVGAKLEALANCMAFSSRSPVPVISIPLGAAALVATAKLVAP